MVCSAPLPAPAAPELAVAVLDHLGAEELDEGVGAAADGAATLGKKSAKLALEAAEEDPALG